MVKKVIHALQKFFSRRSLILLLISFSMSAALVARLFDLQVISGADYADNYTVKTTKTRTLKSSRGNIYDCNGKLLAYNKLANCVTIEDNESYNTMREKNLSLNGEIYRLTKMIRDNGDTLTQDFHITLNADGNYAFDTKNDTTLNRFRADIYGYKTVDELSAKERDADADKIMSDLCSEDYYGLVYDPPFTVQELQDSGLPSELTKQEMLDICIVRYQLSLISFQRYMQVTVAKDVSDKTVANVKENSDTLPGVDIAEDYIRVYTTDASMGPVLGYTGAPSQEELDELSKTSDQYSSTSVIGKAGIEKSMESVLQGTNGSEEVVVDNLGRVLSENTDSKVDPVQGKDVYLTIDSDLQSAIYKILEQRIAGILALTIVNEKSVDLTDWDQTQFIPIPIYNVYFALLDNNVIDVTRFSKADATETEKDAYSKMQDKGSQVISWMLSELSSDSPKNQSSLSDEQQKYMSYLYSTFLTSEEGIVNTSLIDSANDVYQAYTTDGSASLKALLTEAVNNNWIDLSKLDNVSDEYLTSDEIYQAVLNYIRDHLLSDTGFQKLLYKYLLQEDTLSPDAIVKMLYEQGVLSADNDQDYASFQAGNLSASDFMIAKIRKLEITPAQLALDTCSGSMVVTDPDTGAVKACVTYPGYDNNRLSNNMDTDYYYQLTVDKSSPFYNKATQQLTAPGSTYKPVVAAAGLEEGVIDSSTLVNCTGVFGEGFLDEGDYVHCWYTSGHGNLNLVDAMGQSCNVYFMQVGYWLGQKNDKNEYRQSEELSYLHQYSSYFGLDKTTGIQLSESDPNVSDDLAIPSAIGQGTHQYTTTQLARYASTIANQGTAYNLNLVQKIADSGSGDETASDPTVENTCNFSSNTWNLIDQGMMSATTSDTVWRGFAGTVYTKTGTAEESMVKANHALAIGFTDSNDAEHPDVAYAVRIPYGYTSRNASLIARDVLNYYFGYEDAEDILTGTADTSDMYTTISQD